MQRPRMRQFLRLMALLLALLSFSGPVAAQSSPKGIWIPEMTVLDTLPLDAMDEFEGNLYGVGNGQLFRSTDGGRTWIGRNRLFQMDARDLLLLDRQTWLITNTTGTFRSEDGGMSWQQVNDPTMRYGNRMLRYQGRVLLFAYSDEAPGGFGPFLFQSRDKGLTWSRVGRLPAKAADLCTNESQDTLFSFDQKGWHTSADDGRSWTTIQTPLTELPDGAVCRPGRWQAEKAPLPKVNQPKGLDALVTSLIRLQDGTLLYVDLSDMLYRRLPTGKWERRKLPQPKNDERDFYGHRRVLAAGPGSTAYIAGGGVLLVTTDSGATWSEIAPPDAGLEFRQMAAVAGSGRLFVATSRRIADLVTYNLYTTADGGKRWQLIPETDCASLWSSGERVACLDGTPNKARIRLSADGGATWTDWPIPVKTAERYQEQGQFATDGAAVYFSGFRYDPGIYRTVDKGVTWLKIAEEGGTVHSLSGGNGNSLIWDMGSSLRLSENGLAGYAPLSLLHRPLRLFPVQTGEIYGSSRSGGLQRLVVMPQLQDVKGHWSERYVTRLAETGLVSGFPDGTYRPDAPVSRAAAITLLLSAKQYPRWIDENQPFRDATAHWVNTTGILGGALLNQIVRAEDYPGGRLEPDRNTSRAEMARLLVRAAGLEPEVPGAVSPSAFADAGEIAPEFRGYVAVAVKHELLTGLVGGDGRLYFRPQESLTRAQAATVIYRLIARW